MLGDVRRLVLPLLAGLIASATACSLLTDLTGFSEGEVTGVGGDASPQGDAPVADTSPSDAPVDASADAPAPPTDGLLGHWSFDEGSGTVAGDSSPNRTDARVSGAIWTAGKIGGALLFDGVQSSVETIAKGAPIGSRYTIALWVRLDALATPGVLFKTFSSTLSLMAEPGSWVFRWNADATTTETIRAPAAGDVGVWHHLAATHDGVTARLYLDRVPVGSNAASSYDYEAKIYDIGADVRFSTAYTKGAIDEVRIYNRALSPSEIERL